MAILTLNAGSSSLKFGLFDRLQPRLRGQVGGLGARPWLEWRGSDGVEHRRPAEVADMAVALDRVLALAEDCDLPIDAVGHRIVHGGSAFDRPVELSPAVMTELVALEPLAPLHQPCNLAGIRAAMAAFPTARQVGCFDTAFHRGQPFVNDAFALPHAFYEAGVRRYGFHGLSYEYVGHRLEDDFPALAAGKVVVAHLGNGASMCAMNAGRSVASSMGFSVLDGLPMGTRCGQLDPGVVIWLMRERGMDADAVTDLLYRRSGLLGLSGISHDMRELQASTDPWAARAIDYFVFRLRRELGGLAAALCGLDTLVFCGGIGEHAAGIRQRVCDGFGWLGLALDTEANRRGAETISATGSAVTVLRIRTDEEQMIARHVAAITGVRDS